MADEKPRVVAIVQARSGSSRLPAKVLADVCGRPLLTMLLRRLLAAGNLHEVVVATTQSDSDDLVAQVAVDAGAGVFRGPVDDVLARYAGAAALAGADVVVRVTGDCPLVDPALIDELVALFLADPNAGYMAFGPSFPEGADAEVFSREALAAAHSSATTGPDREHVTLWIKDHPERFSIRVIETMPELGHVRLTVDEPEDLDAVRLLVAELGAEPETTIWQYAARWIELRQDAPNSSIGRNEGSWRSQNIADLDLVRKGQIHGGLRSAELLRRSRRVIPGATQTLSKGISQFVEGVTPAFLERGSGCHVFDADGNAYIDYPMALGPVLLGYNHPSIVAAVRRQIAEGSTFTLPHRLEVEVAERVVDLVPAAQMVRFAKNGSDVTSAAVRLARAVTGRDYVSTSGYHGWHDWYVGLTERSAGVPEAVKRLTGRFIWNDVGSFEAEMERMPAAIVIELPGEDPEPGFLEHVRARCTQTGTVFVWDEIVTGFRWSTGGAQEYYDVIPDLVCLGKAMANGMPLSCIAGSADVMRAFDSVFFSGTFGGETVSLAAARATIDEIVRTNACATMWQRGELLRAGISALLDRHGDLDVRLLGHAPRSGLEFHQSGQSSPALRGLFLQETVRRGILFGGPIFVTPAHEPPDLDYTLEALAAVFEILDDAVTTDSVGRLLEGPAPGVVFRPNR